jgi:hypothetical protein
MSGMFVLRSSYVPLLEVVAFHCRFPLHSYLREVAEDGSVVGGVEIEVAFSDATVKSRTHFFWSPGRTDMCLLYEHAALQAIRFLQKLYGFVIADYNYEAMLGYRSLARSGALLAVAATRTSQASASTAVLSPAIDADPVAQLRFLCSQLVSSVHRI